MFEWTLEEYNSLRCQIGTLEKGAHSEYLSMAFAEQGVALLIEGLIKYLQCINIIKLHNQFLQPRL